MNTPKLLSSSTMVGTNVQNISGENIGEIKDLMIDTETGDVAYAVLSFGGFLGIGDKLFAVPLEAIDLESYHTDGKYTLDIEKESLKEAPGFDKDNWPLDADREFIGSVYSHYGYEPYWKRHHLPQ